MNDRAERILVLRYNLIAAGPESQDTDFTWGEFVRRNKDELAATWGYLVNRTLQSAFRHFGSVPKPAEPVAADRAVVAEAMALAARVDRSVGEEAPWALLESDRARAGSILYRALRCVDDLTLMLTPFLRQTCRRRQELLGYEGWIAGPLQLRDVVDAEGAAHTVLTGGYEAWVGRWEPSRLPPAQRLREPSRLLTKLDPATVVASEPEWMEQGVGA